jgi:bacterioferritin-associated ferredoxin
MMPRAVQRGGSILHTSPNGIGGTSSVEALSGRSLSKARGSAQENANRRNIWEALPGETAQIQPAAWSRSGGISSAAFGLRRAAALARYDLNSMIVCSCNVLSDQAVRDLVTASGSQSLTAHEVYGCLGCDMQCGRCTRAIKRILNETLAHCASGCAGCPAKGPSDKVDCSISVAIHGGVSSSRKRASEH